MANINNEQRKNLAKIVEANGNYSDFYAMKYEEADKKMVAKFSDKISAHLAIVKEHNALEVEQEKEIATLKEKQKKEIAEVAERRDKASRPLEDANLEFSSGGRTWSYRRNAYEGNDSPSWRAKTSRFQSDYQKWQRELVASIWASETVEKAKSLVKEFLEGTGKSDMTTA